MTEQRAASSSTVARVVIEGIPDEQWTRAKVEVRSLLVAKARGRAVVPYSELVAQLKAVDFEHHDPRYFRLLDAVSTDEDEQGRGLLTALVVHKAGNMRPGPGFFKLAQKRGRDVKDIDKTWLAEVDRVQKYWTQH